MTLAQAATAALLGELATTPKPGLVDLEHRGAHRDLCLARLRESALALEDVFAAIARCAQGAPPSRELREEIGAIGRRGERTMRCASGGTNTHRGALWALGLLVAGGAALPVGRRAAPDVVAHAAQLAALPDRFSRTQQSNGAVVARRYHAGGARDEARRGFPHVMTLALPLLRGRVAPPDVLLALLAVVDDTCVLHRGGRAGARLVKAGARAVLRAGGVATLRGAARVRALDAALVARNISPGGCADLLAAGIFLAGIER